MRKIFTPKNILLALRIFLPILYSATLIFIFSQSLQTGEQSSKTSSKVVETVQAVFKIIAPQSSLATAEGEALERIHAGIRIFAHFIEFAFLGVIACGCCLVYTREKEYICIASGSLIFVPIIDEFLQSFTANRAAEWLDVAVDFCGGCVGFWLTLACFYIAVRLLKKRDIIKK